MFVADKEASPHAQLGRNDAAEESSDEDEEDARWVIAAVLLIDFQCSLHGAATAPPEFGFSRGPPQPSTVKQGLTFAKDALVKGALAVKDYFTSDRAPPSGADPSALCGKRIRTEDDVLHIANLPDFDKRLSQRDSELLISYLTVPYLRVPLVMAFFASQERINALGSPKLRSVLDGVLFEPSRWLDKLGDKKVPNIIPPPTREHLATPTGLLFNELQYSPHAVLKPLKDMLDLALELDTGAYTQSASPIILYVVRTVVRIETYIKYMCAHNDWLESGAKTGSGHDSSIRGLKVQDQFILKQMRQTWKEVRGVLNDQVFPMLERWCNSATRLQRMDQACVLHAHLCYMYKNLEYDDLTLQSVCTFLSSQMFLSTRFRYGHQAKKQAKAAGGKRLWGFKWDQTKEDEQLGLGIEETELFDIFTAQRNIMIRWLRTNPELADKAMEAVVRVVSLTGTRTRAFDGELKTRPWSEMEGYMCGGRYVPFADEEAMTEEERIAHKKDEEGDTEINLQLGDFRLKSSKVKVLPDLILEMPDCVAVFGKAHDTAIQSAVVKDTSNRQWLRLVGRRHDIRAWRDTKMLPESSFTRAYRPDRLRGDEVWIRQVLEPVRVAFGDVQLYLPRKEYVGADVAMLAGFFYLPDSDKSPATMKEVVVFRKRRLVHVYTVHEHARRFYRSLAFSSDSRMSYHCTPSTADDSQLLAQWKPRTRYAAGPAQEPFEQSASLEITRNLSVSRAGSQTYMPTRLLHGLVPGALLETYAFWQNADDSLVGYAKDPDAHIAPGGPVMLRVELFREANSSTSSGKTDASARIVRLPLSACEEFIVPGLTTSVLPSVREEQARAAPAALTLLDLVNADPDTPLGQIASLFTRVEDLSHVLAWTEGRAFGRNDKCSLSVVELPRLRLSFTPKIVPGPDGGTLLRMYSDDHQGYFISSQRNEQLRTLVTGLPHSLLLENHSGAFAVLLPVSLPRRPNLKGDELSTQVWPS